MSEPSDKAVGAVKKIAGEVLGDGKLYKDGTRQRRDGSERPDKCRDIRQGGSFGIGERT